MRRTWSRSAPAALLAILSLALASACNRRHPGATSADAGPPVDGRLGLGADAAPRIDAGPEAPAAPDAGAALDAGAMPDAPATEPADAGPLRFSDLRYLGAFRLPASRTQPGLEFGGRSLGFNPGTGGSGSLFIGCFPPLSLIAEVSIPEPVNSASLASLNTARFLQPCSDPQAGATAHLDDINGVRNGGILVHEGKLIVSEYFTYDASTSQRAAFIVKPNTDLRAANATGPFAVAAPNIGFLDGWIAAVPPSWQRALGGPVASGNCCMSIITRTSHGPAAFAWDPAKLTAPSAVAPSTPLVYYDKDHTTLGPWDGSKGPIDNVTIYWNNAGYGYRGGGVIPDVGRSILFFGTQGMGKWCYGCGSPANPPQCESGCTECCFEKVNPGDKGMHAYPYQHQILAYDLEQLAAVAAGTRAPHSLVPYAVWPLTQGIVGVDGMSNLNSGGATYDPRTKRIYYTTPDTDGTLPLVQVWEVRQ
jgi:hypothetical protein